MCLFVLASALPYHGAAAATCPSYKSARNIGSFKLASAATASFVPALPSPPTDPADKDAAVAPLSAAPLSLLLTTFGVGSTADSALVLDNASGGFDARALRVLDNSTAWPNEIAPVPSNATRMLTVAGGFFATPSKATGQVARLTLDQHGHVVARDVLSTPRKQFFYHHVAWTDIDGGGAQDDLLAARARFPTVGKPAGELVWLAPPASGSGAWTEQVLAEGPDVYFTPADVDGDGTIEVVAAEFFTAKALAIFSCSARHWAGCVGGQGVTRHVIDESEEAGFFSVVWADINGDGRRDLLATTNAANGHGGVLVYELTGDYRQGAAAWTRHELVAGFKPTLPWLPGRGAVGNVLPFALTAAGEAAGCRPALALSGDDGAFAAILVPMVQDASSWAYTIVKVYNSSGTVGQVAAGDFDGDGAADLVVPDYAEGKVTWLRLSSE